MKCAIVERAQANINYHTLVDLKEAKRLESIKWGLICRICKSFTEGIENMRYIQKER